MALKLRPPKPPKPGELWKQTRDSQVWKSIFRPGSIYRPGYRDTSRDRALAMMNNVLYHLHPVKVKRHGLKLTYTFCLGGLSFFLFILLTITGIFLMFFYRPTAGLGQELAYNDMQALSTSVNFGQLMRNMHRWAAHLMVFTVFLHMARVFYHGAYKPPREFNWVIGVILLTLTLLLSFTGYLLPWDQVALWAVTVGDEFRGTQAMFRGEVKYILIGSREVSPATYRFWAVSHVVLGVLVAVTVLLVWLRTKREASPEPSSSPPPAQSSLSSS